MTELTNDQKCKSYKKKVNNVFINLYSFKAYLKPYRN